MRGFDEISLDDNAIGMTDNLEFCIEVAPGQWISID